jgi:hypothetical protein
MKTLITLFVVLLCPLIFHGQNLSEQIRFPKDLITGYGGWVGNPDSITVRIMPGPPAFTREDSVAIGKAIKKWNDTNSHPKFKLVTSGDPKVSITRNDNIAGLGVTTPHPNWNQLDSCSVKVDTDDGVPVFNILLHELGHCLGLDDTTDDLDVMEGHAPVPDDFSKHDLDETTASAAVIGVSDGVRKAVEPEKAIMPNDVQDIRFPIDDLIPSGSWEQAYCFVQSLDSGVYIENHFLDSIAGMMVVTVYVEPMHADGQFYLHTSVMLPGKPDLKTFLGMYYVNHIPADPVTFECPMDIYMLDGLLHIDWVAYCTYPFGDQLRSSLQVSSADGQFGVKIFPDGDYVLDLEPGEYTFTLYVDDFQVNSASSTENFIITGIDNEPAISPVKLWPNPFTDKCNLALEEEGKIRIFDGNGKLVYETIGKDLVWEPLDALNPGLYFVQAVCDDRVYCSKIVYCK